MAKPTEFSGHPAPFPPGNTYRATCHRVIDGDTITVLTDLGFECYAFETLRLANYDAPESTWRARTLDERRRGIEAAEYLRQMAEGRPVLIAPKTKVRGGGVSETLGRYVADVAVWDGEGWRDVVEAMREAGWVKEPGDRAWRGGG